MKKVTLNDIQWKPTDQYHTKAQTRAYYGRNRAVSKIVIHWWNSPDKSGTLNQTVTYLKRAKNKSIHFVVSGDSVIQMVNMANTAWHAGNCNPVSVGIEVDPKTPGNTYETVGALVKFIRSYYGNIPLVPHKACVATSCPGTISLKKIDDYAYGRIKDPKPVVKPVPKPTPKPAPKPPKAPEPKPKNTDTPPKKDDIHKGEKIDVGLLNELIAKAHDLLEWVVSKLRRK